MKETITEFIELICLVGVAAAAISGAKFIFNYILKML
jgi:hypothetical protein